MHHWLATPAVAHRTDIALVASTAQQQDVGKKAERLSPTRRTVRRFAGQTINVVTVPSVQTQLRVFDPLASTAGSANSAFPSERT
jgi:hypothetical protein